MLLHLPDGYKPEPGRDVLAARINTLPDSLRLSLTWDQGPQMRECRHVCIDAGIDIYFCDPHSPWQRGTNENARADGHPALDARPGCRVGETALRAARRQA
jgi:IS30 family transposase